MSTVLHSSSATWLVRVYPSLWPLPINRPVGRFFLAASVASSAVATAPPNWKRTIVVIGLASRNPPPTGVASLHSFWPLPHPCLLTSDLSTALCRSVARSGLPDVRSSVYHRRFGRFCFAGVAAGQTTIFGAVASCATRDGSMGASSSDPAQTSPSPPRSCPLT